MTPSSAPDLTGPAAPPTPTRWVGLLTRLACLSLGMAVALAPLRYRWLLLAQPFEPVYRDYTDLLLFVGDVCVLLALGFWAAARWQVWRSLGTGRGREAKAGEKKLGQTTAGRTPSAPTEAAVGFSWGPLFLTVPLAGLILVGISGLFSSAAPLLSGYHVVRLLVLFGLYLLVVNEVRGLKEVGWGAAAGVFIQSAVAIVQVLSQHDARLQWLGEYELDPAWNGVSIVWAEGVRSLRAYGLSDHPNILGGVLVMSLLATLGWYLTGDRGGILPAGSCTNLVEEKDGKAGSVDLRTRSQNFMQRLAWGGLVGAVLLGLLALLATFSRSAWLGLATGLLVLTGLLWRGRRTGALVELAGLLAAGALLLAPFAWHNAPYLGVRFNAGGSLESVPYERGSLGERQVLNAAGNELFAAHAIGGVGLGAFPIALRQARPDFGLNYQPPHLSLLAAAAETGLFGALFYFSALAAPWLALWISRRRLAFSVELATASAILAALTAIGLFDYYPWLLAPGRFWQWLAWGLWAAFYMKDRAEFTRRAGAA